MAQLKDTEIDDSGFLQLPTGTTAQRSNNPQAGMIRFNTDDSVLEFYDGTNWIPVSGDTTLTSPTQAFAQGLSAGTYEFLFPSFSSLPVALNYAPYNGKGWVEVLFSTDSALGTPWDHWITETNGGPQGTTDFGSRRGLQNYGVDGQSGISNYSQQSGVILLGDDFAATDFAVTSKSSVSTLDVAATGQNENGAYPLTSASVIGPDTSTFIQEFCKYFLGVRGGFHAESSGGNSSDYAAGWGTSNGVGPFEIVLAYRGGSYSDAEWHIASGEDNDGSTYAPNTGYRDQGASYDGNNVGSWSADRDGKASQYQIDSGNVLSVWLTDG